MLDTRLWILALAAVATSGFNADAVAQEADSGATATGGLEEVIVTARKRDESLLTVPLSVTAFTAKKIQAEGITDLADIASFTPGFNIGNTGSEQGAEGGSHADRATQNLIIRGVFNRASVFIDGAPIADGIVDGVDDLSRVEVVKGPQSAYFGRATFIGALNLVTKDPSDHLSGSAQALVGTSNWEDYRFTVEGPLVQDKLAARLSVRDYSMEGQYRNSGGPEAYLGGQSTKSLDVDIVATPIENLKIKVFGMFWHDSDGPGPVGKYTAANWNCNAGAAPAGTLNYYCGTLPSVNLATVGMNTAIDPLFQSVILNNSAHLLSPILPNFDDHGGLERLAYHWHANITYDIAGLTLTSLTAFNQDHTEDITDVGLEGGTPAPNPLAGTVPYMEPFIRWLFYYQDIEHSWSEELRLANDQSNRFRWTVGSNYTYSFSQYIVMQDSIFGGPLSNQPGSPNDSGTVGEFFSAAYDLTHALTLNLEGRFQADDIRQYTRTPVVPLNGDSTTSLAAKKTFDNFVPRVILQYKFQPQLMAYASFSEGVSPGGFNTSLIAATPYQLAGLANLIGNGAVGPEYLPEKLYNYEFGIKGQLLDNRLQWTADVYYADWDNQQVVEEVTIPQVNNLGQPTGGLGVTTATANIGKTVLDGIETEGSFAITPQLIASWSGAVNASDIKSYSCYDPCAASITGNPNVDGNQLPYYSKYSATLGLEYERPLSPSLGGFGRVDFIYKSGMYDTYSNTAKTQPTERVNIHLGVKSSSRFSIDAFVLNATNNLAPTSIEANVDVLNNFGNDINVGLPLKRQFGVKGRYDF